MARTTYAQTEQKSAPLASEFGISYATRLFCQDAIDSLPRLQAGTNNGKPKGHIIWRKTTTPGYHPNAGCGVPAGSVVRAWVGIGPLSGEDGAMVGLWLGRKQTLCGSRGLLSAEYRAQHAAEMARDAAELNARFASMAEG
jgi:hypothetical protein